jgi:hypothetical protein
LVVVIETMNTSNITILVGILKIYKSYPRIALTAATLRIVWELLLPAFIETFIPDKNLTKISFG